MYVSPKVRLSDIVAVIQAHYSQQVYVQQAHMLAQ
jgi:hypothetical protein